MDLPLESYGTIKDGLWIVHREEDQIIRVWGSFKNGKEKVFLNDELISENRNMKMNSEHRFTDKQGAKFYIRGTFSLNPKREPEIYISKDDLPGKTYKILISRKKFDKKTLISLVILLGVVILIAAIWTFLELHFVFLLIPLLIAYIVFLKSLGISTIEVKEVDHNA